MSTPSAIPVQLRALADVLREMVGPQVTDAYASDILRGAVAALQTLSAASRSVGEFMKWDIVATADVLRLVDVEPSSLKDAPSFANDREAELLPDDPAALELWQRILRQQLAMKIDRVRENPAASTAAAAHFRERARRYPFVTQSQGA